MLGPKAEVGGGLQNPGWGTPYTPSHGLDRGDEETFPVDSSPEQARGEQGSPLGGRPEQIRATCVSVEVYSSHEHSSSCWTPQ